MARSAVNGSRLAGMHPWKRGAWLMGSTLAYRGQLVGQLLGRDHAGVRATHDVQGRALDVGPEGGDAVLHHHHPVLAVEPADHGGQHADVGHGAGQHQRRDAACPQSAVEHRAVEAVVVVLAHHQLVRPRGQLRDHRGVRISLEARRRGAPKTGRLPRLSRTVLRVQGPHQQRRRGGVGELGEHHRQALLAEDLDQGLDARHHLARGGDLHRLALLHERALHVDDHERGAFGVEGEGRAEKVVAVQRSLLYFVGLSGRSFTSLGSAVARLPRWARRSLVYFLKALYIRSARLWLASHYQAETENAFGMWRIALTAPSSLKITETTSNRQETWRRR